ncbi:hypothetical protein PROFUN_07006 [Planoprotostelium fungivorum]|uniref:PH domain-containing protein n=1 Tax=Planoprotostelium fungivorum TaxID=1890364 RepID=A0A2P6NMP4_9EUKA|nr:hypothetical protein PROFUN_07006 [Planoprotostelium fungivorum]
MSLSFAGMTSLRSVLVDRHLTNDIGPPIGSDMSVNRKNTAVRTPILEGFLWKRGEGITGLRWKKRWFTLLDDKLFYYVKKGDAPLGNESFSIGWLIDDAGSVDLTASKRLTIHVPKIDPSVVKKPNTFSFFIQTTERSWSLLAEDQMQLDSWVSALQKYSTNQRASEPEQIDDPLMQENLFTELSDDERINLKRLFQHPFKMHASGFVRIFKFIDIPAQTKEFQWTETGVIGALTLVEQTVTRQFSFRVLDPETSAVSWVYPVDIMNLNYEEETEYFHSFDGNKEDLEESQGMDALQRMETDYRIGLSFSSTVESQLMCDKVVELRERVREDMNAPPVERESQTEGVLQQITEHPTVRKYLKIFQKNMDDETEEAPPSEISSVVPGTFQHLAHVGVSSEGTVETRGQLPSEWISQNEKWKDFFIEAGAEPAELNDDVMAKDLIESTTQFLLNLQPTVPEKQTADEMRESRRSSMLSGHSTESLQAALDSKSYSSHDGTPSSYNGKSFSFRQVPNAMPKLKPNEENELKNKIGTFILDRRKLKEQLAAEE